MQERADQIQRALRAAEMEAEAIYATPNPFEAYTENRLQREAPANPFARPVASTGYMQRLYERYAAPPAVYRSNYLYVANDISVIQDERNWNGD